jgi:Cu2+-exporting ATPase
VSTAAAARDFSGFVTPTDRGTARLELAVQGITCAACIPQIEHGLAALPGVVAARVNLTTRRLAVEWAAGDTDARGVIERLSRLGYRAQPFDPDRAEAAEDAENKRLLKCLAVAAFAAMNVMLLSVSVWSGNASDITGEQRDLFHWISGVIAIPAAAYAGRPFFESAVRALRARSLNMDVPITLGVLLALGLSVVETAHSAEHAYFDSAVMLLTFLLAGRFLDHNMRRRTRAVAQNLAALRAESALRLRDDGTTQEVPLSKLAIGDRVLVRPGERVAVDGVVERGTSEIDRSLVTGETTPELVEPGRHLEAGTLNGAGALTLRVTAAAQNSFLGEVSRLIENAAEARSRYVRLADRASRLYAPVVHVTAFLTLTGWVLAGAGWHFGIVTAIAVLIITCPCALGLAVPAVQVVAAQALFRAGVLIHAGDAIERLAAVDTVLFDKTGTLTLPEAEIVNRDAVPPDLLLLAAGLAAASRHPLAIALARAEPGVEPLTGEEVAGQGVRAMVDGVECRLGAPDFCGAVEAARALVATAPDASIIAVRRGSEAAYVLGLRQGLRSDAREVVAALLARGLAVEILSGDRPAIVADVAGRLGVERHRGGMSPADKIARIEVLKASGRTVLMVGDGLNDAPALQAASVSLSPVTAVHLSQAASDAVFLGERLGPVVAALAISKRARRVMQENLWLSVIYNLVAVPAAVAGLATPLVAALAMSGSSMLVTLNALRARPARGEALPGRQL